MNQRLLFLCFIIMINSLSAQRLVRVNASTPVCAIEGNVNPKDRNAFKASSDAQKTIEDICRKIGASPNAFIIEAANVKNAEALILGGKRYIHYNPMYINKIQKESQSYWAMIFVLAHEIGHHINGHTLDNSDLDKRRSEELDADKFGGCALQHSGASLEELEKAASVLSESGDEFHPPQSVRLVSAVRGWEDCVPKNNNKIFVKPPKSKDCEKTTGDIYFKNTTKRPIRIHTSPQSGWYDQYHFITIDAGDTKGFLDLNAGRQAFAIRISSGGTSFEDYKNEEIRIEPCADESQQPIIIR